MAPLRQKHEQQGERDTYGVRRKEQQGCPKPIRCLMPSNVEYVECRPAGRPPRDRPTLGAQDAEPVERRQVNGHHRPQTRVQTTQTSPIARNREEEYAKSDTRGSHRSKTSFKAVAKPRQPLIRSSSLRRCLRRSIKNHEKKR